MDMELQKMALGVKLNRFVTRGSLTEIFVSVAALFWSHPSPASLGLGLSMFVLGLFLFLWPLSYSRKPNTLEGLYGPWKWMRHPELSGRLLIATAPLIAARNPFVFLVCIFPIVLTFKRRKDRQDLDLRSSFDVDYGVYALEVPAFYPTLFSLVDPPGKNGLAWIDVTLLRRRVPRMLTSSVGVAVIVHGIILVLQYLRQIF